MATSTQNAFQSGDDFISLPTSPPPRAPPLPSLSQHQNAEAGPSRRPAPSAAVGPLPGSNQSLKGREQFDTPRSSKQKTPKDANGTPAATPNKLIEEGKTKSKKRWSKEKKEAAAKAREAAAETSLLGKEPRDAEGRVQSGEPSRAATHGEPSRRGEQRGSKRRGSDGSGGRRELSANSSAPWTGMVDWETCGDPAEMLNAEIEAYYRYMSPTRAEYEVRLLTIEIITRAVLELWPDAEVSPFGSWQTQLYLPQGDIDLVISTKRFSESRKAALLTSLGSAMRNARITNHVAVIAKARVPIIKFVTLDGKLNVDISLNQSNGISAGQIINQYLESLPGARQLILVVKAFLSQRSMNEVFTGGLGSYSVICLVISFLQIHPKLRAGEIHPEDNLGTLLIEFFELYGRHFNYDDVGISIRRGGRYFNKKRKGWYKGAAPFLLSIEDPQDVDNDISGGSFGIRQVRNTLAGAYEILQARLFERAEAMVGRRSGRYLADPSPEDMSMLSGLMSVSPMTRRHREELNRLHASGSLQRMLGIPPNADVQGFVKHYRPRHVIGVKRTADTSVINGIRSTGPISPGNKKRRVGNVSANGSIRVSTPRNGEEGGVGAVILDDGDVINIGGFSDSDEGEGEGEASRYTEGLTSADEHDDDNDDDEEGESRDSMESGEIDSSSEDFQIIDVQDSRRSQPERRTGCRLNEKKNRRFESVSHDSDDYEEAERIMGGGSGESSGPDRDEEVQDSRYTLTRTLQRDRNSNQRGPIESVADMDDIDELDSDSDDSSIIALDLPPTRNPAARGFKPIQPSEPRPATKVANGSISATSPAPAPAHAGSVPVQPRSQANGLSAKARREFWAAKAVMSRGGGASEDEFENGMEFVGLD